MYKEINTIEEAIKRYKEPVDLEKMKSAVAFLPKQIAGGMLALAMLQIAVWTVNNDDPAVPEWKADFNDEDQEKWFPWYRGGNSTGSGFRFYGTYCGWTYTHSAGGARLALKDEERAEHMNEFFQELYKQLWLILE